MATAVLHWKCKGCEAKRSISGNEPEFYSDPVCKCGGQMEFAGLAIVDVTPEAICSLASGIAN